LVGPGVGKAGDQPEPGLADPRPGAVDEGQLPYRREYCPLRDQLLHLLQYSRATPMVDLGCLVLKHLVDIGIAAVSVSAALDGGGLETGRGIAEGAGAALNDVLERLFAVS